MEKVKETIWELRAYIYVLFGLLCQTLVYAYWQTLVEKHIDEFAISSYRGTFYCIFGMVDLIRNYHKPHYKSDTSQLPTLLFRGMVNGVGITLILFCVGLVRLSTMELLLRTGNIMSTFLSYCFLKEVITRYDIYGLFTTFFGVILIIRPAFLFGSSENKSDSIEGIIITSGCTLLVALGQLASKKLMNFYNEFHLIFVMGFSNLLVGMMGSVITNKPVYLPLDIVVRLFFCTLLEYIGNYYIFKAYSLESVVKLSPFFNAKIVFAVILTYIISRDISFWDVLGSIIIISSYVYLSLMKINPHQSPKKSELKELKQITH
jgi:drug/metabolite transporter (DMT)-like permease